MICFGKFLIYDQISCREAETIARGFDILCARGKHYGSVMDIQLLKGCFIYFNAARLEI